MPIRESLQLLDARDRAILKASTIASLALTRRYTVGDLRIDIERARANGPMVECYARAWKAGVQVGFGSDGSVEWERFRFFNPPIMVPDGTKRTVTPTIGPSYQVDNFKEDPVAALVESLAHTIKVSGKVGAKITPGKRGNTTSTFYPDAHPETTSVDGYSAVPSGGTWAGARDATDGTETSDTTDSNIWCYVGPTAVYRGFALFDTSSIDDADTIDSATFSIYVAAKLNNDNDGDDFVTIVTSSPASNTALVHADFDQIGTVEQGVRIDLTDMSTGAYVDWAFNATGRGNISKTGISKFAVREGHDFLNSPAVGTSGINGGYYAEDTGTSRDPKLVVEHSRVRPNDGMLAFF